MKLKQLMQELTDLGKKAEELDKILTDLKTGINDVLWDLMEYKKIRTKKIHMVDMKEGR